MSGAAVGRMEVVVTSLLCWSFASVGELRAQARAAPGTLRRHMRRKVMRKVIRKGHKGTPKPAGARLVAPAQHRIGHPAKHRRQPGHRVTRTGDHGPTTVDGITQ
ncbi:hypothetical protein HOK021_33570 [Streptomyces hygroscopicus]|nr:hypothetical protein HOK021_33570 [Streptomyces hygroscopicus]